MGDVLFEFLGVKKGAEGRYAVEGDVELIASAPFRLGAEEGETGHGVDWTFSTFDLDRFGERVDPEGWDFARYMDNPVVEWAHCYDVPAIGRAENLYVDEQGLHGSIVFNAKEYDPFGWGIGERVKAGVIRAGSVGFRVIEIEIPGKEQIANSNEQRAKNEQRAGSNEQIAKNTGEGGTLIFRKQELLEFSICNVPANPWALAKALSKRSEELGVSEELGGRRENIIPDFWGHIINHHTGGNYG
jgi:phage head maturation protease